MLSLRVLRSFEEAGVHGRIETPVLAHYIRPHCGSKQGSSGKASAASTVVHTYLCEVRRLSSPQDSNRNRTWLSAEKAKLWLRQDRPAEFDNELATVVDCAVSRIRLLQAIRVLPNGKESLQAVYFKASESMCWQSGTSNAALIRSLLQQLQ